MANYVVLRVVDFVAAQSTADLGNIYIQFRGLIDGRQDREQRWKDCVDVLSSNLPFAIGAAYVEKYFKANTKASVAKMLNNIKEEFVAVIVEAEWIDERVREKLLHKLSSLVPLIAHPEGGFDEQAINEFYDGVKVDNNQYLRNLFRLRVIDADSKFRQTFKSTALENSNNWNKYLPPTTVNAFYSQADNTIRKSELRKLS